MIPFLAVALFALLIAALFVAVARLEDDKDYAESLRREMERAERRGEQL